MSEIIRHTERLWRDVAVNAVSCENDESRVKAGKSILHHILMEDSFLSFVFKKVCIHLKSVYPFILQYTQTFILSHTHKHFQSLTMLHLGLTLPLLLFKNQNLEPVANETQPQMVS